MPLHRLRMIERGFNQAQEIARPIAKKLQINIDCHTLIRQKFTQPQATLPKSKRQQNIKNAFLIKKKISMQHVAILDDVMTTGFTMAALHQTLIAHGVKTIDIWCVARGHARID